MPVVVCAYGEVGHAALTELLDLHADVALVVTHGDAPGENIWFHSVAELARSAGVPTILPADVNSDDAVAAIAAVHPDFLFSFYFRQMMKKRVLALPSRGAFNLHGSLLPRYRGRAPVNWVLVHGERETGLTLHEMDEKPDHGDVVAQRRVPITRDDTALTLTRKLAAEARLLLRDVYPALVAGTAPRTRQDHASSTYFGGRRPADGAIDWRRPAEEIRNLVRAVTDPWPGAFTALRGRKLLVWWAETRDVTQGSAPGRDVTPGSAPGRDVTPGSAPGRDVTPGSAPGTVLADPEGRVLVATGDGALELVEVGWEGGVRESGVAWAKAAGVVAGERFDVAPAA